MPNLRIQLQTRLTRLRVLVQQLDRYQPKDQYERCLDELRQEIGAVRALRIALESYPAASPVWSTAGTQTDLCLTQRGES